MKNHTIITALAAVALLVIVAGCVSPAAALIPPCGPGCHLEFDHGLHCICPPPGCHYDCHGRWCPWFGEWVLTCPPPPTPAPTVSVSYLPVYVADIWNHRCVKEDLQGPSLLALDGNTSYDITFTDTHGLDGVSVCYGRYVSEWNTYVNEERLAGGAILAFRVPDPAIGLVLRATPMWGTGDISVTVNDGHRVVYQETTAGEVNTSFTIR